MHHFRLLMHAGTLDENGNHQTKSKMEAMLIPAHPMTQEDIDAAPTDIVFGTQYVPFTQEFQYLGSRMNTDLKDVTHINNRLRQAKGQKQQPLVLSFVQLLTHGQSDSSSLPSLCLLHSTALKLGHSMWNSADEYLPSTTPATIRRIIGINMHHVAEYQIKNEHIHNYFSVPDPIDITQKCKFNLLGKFAHMDPTRLPCKFLTTWVSHPRHSGGWTALHTAKRIR
jgi:hypothetical protein